MTPRVMYIESKGHGISGTREATTRPSSLRAPINSAEDSVEAAVMAHIEKRRRP
jgi:hypothetical protein